MKKLVLETTAPFQGLPELVAYDEGLFAKEGLEIEWADREKGVEKKVETDVTARRASTRSPATASCSSRARPTCTTPANGATTAACRTPASAAASSAAAPSSPMPRIVVRPDSPVYTPQQLANRTVGVPFYFGTHYLALHLLEGFLPREHDQAVPRAERLALSLRCDDARRDRRDHADRAAHHAGREEGLPHHLLGVLSRHRGGVRPRRCRDLRGLQSRGARGGAPHQRQQDGLPALFHRLSRQEGSGDRGAQGRGPAREPARGLRSGADPARRDAAHLRLAQELGHAGGDRVAAAARQHPGAGLRAHEAAE